MIVLKFFAGLGYALGSFGLWIESMVNEMYLESRDDFRRWKRARRR